MIDQALVGTSVTCVLIGENTSQREYVGYEIEKRALNAVTASSVSAFHNIKDQNQKDRFVGTGPSGAY